MFFFTSCGVERGYGFYTDFTPRQMAEHIIANQAEMPPMHMLTPEDGLFGDFLTYRYRVDTEKMEITDGIIFYAGGALASEIAVLVLADATMAPALRDLLFAYIHRRRAVFSGYAPTQAALLSGSIVSIHGNHVALLIMEEAGSAALTFLACFTDPPPELPQNRNEPISAAPTDLTGLTVPGRQIYDKSAYILKQLITDCMDDRAKQTAVHDWIIDWAVFDTGFFESPGEANPHSYTPYGVLFYQQANCFGFAYTFQLFMDLLHIPAVTVHGTVFTGMPHAWNLVQLEGAWYAVDITWNNPVDVPRDIRSTDITHRFFNVTSEKLFFYGHRWDRDSVPEAMGSSVE